MSNGLFGIIFGYIMLGIIIIALVAAIIKAIIDKDMEYILFACLTGVAAGVLLVGIPLCLGYENRASYYDSYEKVLYEEIESVDRGLDTEGHFSLFSGYVESDVAYFFYVETERGYELKQVTVKNGNKIYLVEDNTRTPQIIQKKEVGEHAYIQIIVPVGTVVKEYRG